MNVFPSDVFAFFENSSELELGKAESNLGILKKKLEKAGLGQQYESLKRRSLSTERILLEDAIKEPELLSAMMDQLEGTVLTVCSDAILESTEKERINGIEAFKNTYLKLKKISKTTPQQVYSKNVDCLIGITGLLTGACKLWWSEEFDLDEGL